MEDQNKFLELLGEIREIAMAQDNRLTQQEIKEYLRDMELTEKQWQAVYQYLGTNQIRVEGYAYVPAEAVEESASEALEKQNQAARKRSWYQQELQNLPLDRREVPVNEIIRFLQGEEMYRGRIIESRLHQVVDIAERYQKYAVPAEELIAEGNLGLLHGMMAAEAERERFIQGGQVDITAFLEVLEQEVILAVERYIDRETESRDQESAMLAKTNLLHEAAKYMAEEIGRIPTIEELSEYTKISEKEIHQIMGLSEDAKRVASPRQ